MYTLKGKYQEQTVIVPMKKENMTTNRSTDLTCFGNSA